jgi:hypothetical protein
MKKKKLNTRNFFLELTKEIEKTDNKVSVEAMEAMFLTNNGGSEKLQQNIWKVLTRWRIYTNPENRFYKFTEEEIAQITKIGQSESSRLKRKDFLQLTTTKNTIVKEKKITKQQDTTIEVIFQGNLTEEALDKLLGGKILQEKRGIYKIEVPSENQEKLYSLWLNSEVNNLGIVMLDVKLEKKFQEHRSKL